MQAGEIHVLVALLLAVGLPVFGVYPVYLFRKGRLSVESLAVYLLLAASIVGLSFGAVFSDFRVFLAAFLLMIIAVILGFIFRKELWDDAFSVEVSPSDRPPLLSILLLKYDFWVWIAYRLGSTRAAFLEGLANYVAFVGTIALLNHVFWGSYPVRWVAVLYHPLLVFHYRQVYRRLYEKTGIE